ncbi:arabinan endo-1,5-alpha-L-arabinosidase [Arachidicoccus ginsenosidivorans]|uniref:Arabinan endo-1,5-alpha-L-arabinosidase n=1 Tax=Arachidicoccus ginsenosidivorans TaxID=496057 RepID=A0A5B8VKS7_9BACT|nr:arabinan endo-1,5-alpha-L-arabinosidase [Arachidicoccus ginsenosidivorans]QEC72110.1 arabinan endo-1,5-alpha-L-arabinosidase [Arachidicoccus ginsenosidivorans]
MKALCKVKSVRFLLIFNCLVWITVNGFGQTMPMAGPYGVHDPVMIKQDSSYYLFCTGQGITCFSTSDLVNWKRLAPVFKTPPLWAVKAVPGYKGHTWAPDICFHNGKYWLLYSVSAFGKNTSCIGLAENITLDLGSKDYKWVDHGKLIQSVPGRDDWNAIDPNMVFDENNHPWVCFGSFWNGIKLVRLKDDLSAIDEPQSWYSLARRPRKSAASDTAAGNGAIEGPFIFKKGAYYYLFVSFDYCCRGINSNYKVMVGRSKSLTGPYIDKSGTPMLEGGGSPVVTGNKRYPGVGHCGVYTFGGNDFIIFHGYDREKNGRPRLLMEELQWDEEGWPIVKSNFR